MRLPEMSPGVTRNMTQNCNYEFTGVRPSRAKTTTAERCVACGCRLKKRPYLTTCVCRTDDQFDCATRKRRVMFVGPGFF